MKINVAKISSILIFVSLLILVLMISGYGLVPVLAANPYISANLTSAPPGTTITVTGTGFSDNETGITITFAGNTITSGILANSRGNWSGTFTVPYVTLGQYIIGAYGSVTSVGSVVGITFTVINPDISVSPTSGPPGTLATVTGTGFAGNEFITITFEGNTVVTGILVNSQGNWSGSFTIPQESSGDYSISAFGSVTLAIFVPEIDFAVSSPSIVINRTSGSPGTSVTISGSGFAANENITITYDGNPIGGGISANSQGSWNGSFTVPASPSGSHLVDAYGFITPASSVPGLTFIVTPGISTSKISAPPGTSITVTGSGFAANENITITFDGNPAGPAIAANSQGSWTGSLTIPQSSSGTHSIGAYGSTTAASAVTAVTFNISATITINPSNGPPATVITISGSGFGAGETGIIVTYDGKSVASNILANAQGSWSTTFIVPASNSGSHSINAYGAVTQASSVTGVIFIVNPVIKISPASGPPGVSISATGSGFGAGETGINITYDGNPVASGITADAQGNWSSTFTVPPSAAGTHNVQAYGSINQVSSVSGASYRVKSAIFLSPASGYVGETVQVSGFGFAVTGPITLTYDDISISLSGASTDANGSFVKSFTIPKSIAGDHTITVVDWQQNSAAATFTMSSTPPPIPTPLSPTDGSRVGLLGGNAPTFKWSNVTDPSGVTYSLQVDTNPNFPSPVIEKTNIPTNQYTLSATEALPLGTYYWRVQAINGASSQSAWSQPFLLKSGLLAAWTLILIIIIIIAVVGVGIYFFLHTRARKPAAIKAPEVVVPQVVTGQWRAIEPEEATQERQLPWRLSLPEPPKGAKTFSSEDQARLKVIIDFAQSLPLVRPSYNVEWLLDLIETGMGIQITTQVYTQLFKGELVVRYEPAWIRHPAYQDLTTLLKGQHILQELEAYIDAVNGCAADVVSLLQQIYRDAVTEIPTDFVERKGWDFISAVYTDAMNWFIGKSLSDPSERDYISKSGDADLGPEKRWLCGVEATSFAGEIILADNDQELGRLRALHLRLRRTWRNNNQARQVSATITRLDMEQGRLLGFFSQFGQLKR
jgi:hypothetical protein